MKNILNNFWKWYERHTTFATALSAALFTLQLFHLYWLTTHVVFFKLFGHSFFDPHPILQLLILLADYLEIPAIIATSILYIHQIRSGNVNKGLFFLLLLNSQWLHMFWITDEYVLETFGGHGIGLPGLLAWVAIGIDYLELPVIFDTLRSTYRSFMQKS